MSSKATVCLNMIVKDESHVIKRCLESVKDVIDYWVISDTGSTDDTQQIIKDFFKEHGIPGELLQHEWKNFSYNRNLALQAAKEKADYLFFMDADDQFVCPDGFQFELSESDYFINSRLNLTHYARRHLIRTDIDWRWVGVIHEHLECDEKQAKVTYSDCYIIASTEGARGKNPDRFKADAEILKEALTKEPNNHRYQFYLARSYHSDKNYQQALVEYQKRVEMGGWEEEVYYSLYEIGKIQGRLGMDLGIVLNSLLKAHHYRPSRMEALYTAVELCRRAELYHLGYQLGHEALHTPVSTDVLFVNQGIYLWQFKDEMSVCASWVGCKNEARDMINEILKVPDIPVEDRERIINNLSYC